MTWEVRPWTREEYPIIADWWKKMEGAGKGDWGTGPTPEQLSPFGYMAWFEGQPVSVVFLYTLSSGAYIAVFSAICDMDLSKNLAFKGLIKVAEASIAHAKSTGAREIVSYVRTPAVVKAFEIAGFVADGIDHRHVYLSDEDIPWLTP